MNSFKKEYPDSRGVIRYFSLSYLKKMRMETLYQKRILEILQSGSDWLSFDDLYRKADTDCDWVLFAEQLSQLVEDGRVKYTLPRGADVGYYGIQ